MTFKPMTYLVSFTLFVLLFMGLGGYVGYIKISDHFLVQSFLEATPINAHVVGASPGDLIRWEDKVALPEGISASILASDRTGPISITFSDERPHASQGPTSGNAIPLAANERTEDLRIDPASRYLYARVFASSRLKGQETTWLWKYDLRTRKLLRRTAVNPIMLPVPFKP